MSDFMEIETSVESIQTSRHFVNNSNSIVLETLLGLVTCNPRIALLNFGPVIVRRDYVGYQKVKIISGGPSGHEPAFSGFVGRGMLTAAIQGDIFCSPTCQDILQTIREISFNQDTGVLIIIPNSIADRLSFSTAFQRARNLGIEIKMIILGDECCPLQGVDPNLNFKGLGGIVLFHKIAGAMAEKGECLDIIYFFFEELQKNICSMVFSLNSAVSPHVSTCTCENEMSCNEIEFGIGLQGEAGIKHTKMSVHDTCEYIIQQIIPQGIEVAAGDSVVLLVNNLGGSLVFEELIVVNELVSQLNAMHIGVNRAYYGRYLTSLEKKGFSITILKIFDEIILDYLDAPCEASAWHQITTMNCASCYQIPIEGRLKGSKCRQTPLGPRFNDEQANVFMIALQFCCDALVSCEKQINMYDAENGSGNMGTKFSKFAQTFLRNTEENRYDFHYPRGLFIALSELSENVLGDSIGCLYTIMFESVAFILRNISEDAKLTINDWFKCFQEATDSIKSCENCGCGTMYDAIFFSYKAMELSVRIFLTDYEIIESMVVASENSAVATTRESKHYPDPSAHVVAVWMRALFEGLKVRLYCVY